MKNSTFKMDNESIKQLTKLAGQLQAAIRRLDKAEKEIRRLKSQLQQVKNEARRR